MYAPRDPVDRVGVISTLPLAVTRCDCVRDLAERLGQRLILVERARLRAVREQVVVRAANEARRHGAEEEQPVLRNRTADRAADLVTVVRLLVVLQVEDRRIVDRAELDPLDRAGADPVAGVVIVALATELVAARLGDRADHAAERAAVLGVDAARLDLHFLQVLEDGVLPRAALDQAVGRNAVHEERVLGAAGAMHLEAAFDVTGVHAGRHQRDALERARLRDPVELFRRHVVRAA